MRGQMISVAALAGMVALVGGCVGDYCQSGAKYGTHCYDTQGSQAQQPTGASADTNSTANQSPQRTPATTPR